MNNLTRREGQFFLGPQLSFRPKHAHSANSWYWLHTVEIVQLIEDALNAENYQTHPNFCQF